MVDGLDHDAAAERTLGGDDGVQIGHHLVAHLLVGLGERGGVELPELVLILLDLGLIGCGEMLHHLELTHVTRETSATRQSAWKACEQGKR